MLKCLEKKVKYTVIILNNMPKIGESIETDNKVCDYQGLMEEGGTVTDGYGISYWNDSVLE
jgi:hypothetical protein